MSLPGIYKNQIDQDIRNSQTTYYGKSDDINKDENLFSSLPVTLNLETNKGKMQAIVIAKTDNYIITSKNDVINLKDIISMKKP